MNWLLLFLLLVGVVIGWFVIRAARTIRAAQVDVAERPEVVWDKDGFPWRLKANGRYRLADENTDGCFDDWPLDAVDRVFGPVTTTPPDQNEELDR